MPHRTPKPGNSFGDHSPELIKEWSSKNELSPFDYCRRSNESVWWICPKGHKDYLKTCDSRVGRREGCPTCSHKGPPPLEESLGFKRADLIFEWSEENERSIWEVWPSSVSSYKWKCLTGVHEDYPAIVANRTKKTRPTGCPECWYERMAYERSIPPYNLSIAYLRPDLIPEWSSRNDRSPNEVYAKGGYEAWWKCPNGHPDYLMRCGIRSNGHGCYTCGRVKSGRKKSNPLSGHSFGDLYPELLKEYSPENDKSPFDIKRGADYLAKWSCSKGHTWNTHVYSRTGSEKTGCPHCFKLGQSHIENEIRKSLVNYGAQPTTVKLGKWEVDIYIPEKKIVIEYDGDYFHSNPKRIETDTRKSLNLLSLSYKVIRIRDSSILPTLQISSSNYYEIDWKYKKTPDKELLDKLLEIL